MLSIFVPPFPKASIISNIIFNIPIYIANIPIILGFQLPHLWVSIPARVYFSRSGHLPNWTCQMAFWRKKEGRKPREVFCLFIKKGGKILERKSKRKTQAMFLKWKLITFGSCVCICAHTSLSPPLPPCTESLLIALRQWIPSQMSRRPHLM